MRNTGWLVPIFIVLALVVVCMVIMYLPSTLFGIDWTAYQNNLFIFMPWLIVFGVGLYTLKIVITRK